jgi:hypothetical protein
MKFSLENDIPIDLKEKVIQKAKYFLLEGDSVCISAMLNSLSNMNYQWKNGGSLEEAIFQGIIASFHPSNRVQTKAPYRAREVCHCIYFLGKLSKGLMIGNTDVDVHAEKNIILNKDILDSFWSGIENQWRAFFPERIHEIFYG